MDFLGSYRLAFCSRRNARKPRGNAAAMRNQQPEVSRLRSIRAAPSSVPVHTQKGFLTMNRRMLGKSVAVALIAGTALLGAACSGEDKPAESNGPVTITVNGKPP